MKSPTLREIARLAGVSHATASLVLNEKGNISAETRSHVKSVIRQHGYKRQPSSRVIGIVGSPPGRFYSALQLAAAEYGFDLKPLQWDGTQDLWGGEIAIGGAVIYGGRWDPETLDCINRQYPTVLLGSHTKTTTVDSIWVDNADGIYQAVNYLTANGHRHIGLINGPKDTVTSWEKQSGFERALTLAGPGVQGTVESCPSFGRANACLAAAKILTESPHTSALITAETSAGLAVLRWLTETGYRVPADVSLIIFRDDERLGAAVPPVTAIGFSYIDIARETLSHLVQRISEPKTCGRRVLFKPYLVERDSVQSNPGRNLGHTESTLSG